MSRYKYTKLRNLGPVHGFLIHTPDDRKLKDVNPQFIVRELNRMADRINRLEEVGDEMARWLSSSRNLGDDPFLSHKWRKAKEANP